MLANPNVRRYPAGSLELEGDAPCLEGKMTDLYLPFGVVSFDVAWLTFFAPGDGTVFVLFIVILLYLVSLFSQSSLKSTVRNC